MSELIPVEQVELMIAERVAAATREMQAAFQREIDRLMTEAAHARRTLADQIVPLQEALAHAKQVIAKL